MTTYPVYSGNRETTNTYGKADYRMVGTATPKFTGADPEIRLEGNSWSLAGLYNNSYPVPRSFVFGAENPGVVLRLGTGYSVTTRATVGECYDAIEEDLQKAISLMSDETVRGKDTLLFLTPFSMSAAWKCTMRDSV